MFLSPVGLKVVLELHFIKDRYLALFTTESRKFSACFKSRNPVRLCRVLRERLQLSLVILLESFQLVYLVPNNIEADPGYKDARQDDNEPFRSVIHDSISY
jgi:hypothetical protein